MSDVRYAIVAHQGGWDETLFILLPVAIFAGLLALANRRATAAAANPEQRPDASDVEPAPDAANDDPTP